MPIEAPTWEETVSDETPKWSDTVDIAPEPFPVIPPSPARTPEELSYRNMMGEQALGTAVPAPVAHGPLLDVPAALPETLIRASMKVPIPSLAQAIRLLPESEREPAIKGISESAAEGLSGLTTPENLAIGAGLAIAPEIGLPLLVAHMQSQVPEALQAIDEAETPQQKWKARANLAQLAGMIVAPAAKPILKGLRGTERIEAIEQPVPPVIPRGPEPPPLPVEAPPEPPPPIPKPIERVVEDYIEPEPTETVVKGEEFAVPAKAAEVLPEAARAAEETGAKIEQPAVPAVEPEKGVTDAIPIREAETVHVGEAPGDRGAVEQGVREQAPTEAPVPEAPETRSTGAEVLLSEPTPAKAKEPVAGGEKKQRKIGQQQIRHLFDRETEAIGGTDILDWISQNMRLMSKSAARKKMGSRFARNKGEYDDAPRVPVHHNERIYGGNALPDQVAQAAYEARVLRSPDVTELWQAVDRASKTRRKAIGTEAREGSTLETAADFVEKATEPSTDKLNQPVDELRVGDAFEIEGQRIEVVKIEEDGTAVLKDGTRWGIQRISPDQTVWVESFEPSESEAIIQAPQTKTTSGEPFKLDEPESVEQQKARLAREEEARKAKEAKATIEAKSAAPLAGSVGDIGQGDLLGGGDLFSGKAPPAAAEPGKGPGMVGMGGAVPSEFIQSPETPTGIRNRVVDQERARRGLPPAVEPAKRSFGEVWDRAMSLIDRDPVYQDRLIDELREKPRALTDIEDATILQRQIDLQNEYGKATRDLAQAYDDGRMPDVEREKLRVAGLSDRLLDLYDIGKKVGTETGRGLNARRMMAYEDFSLAKMELEKRAANGGRRLTDAERQQIEALHNDIKRLDKAYDQYLESRESRLAELEADAAMGKLKAQSPLDKRVLDYAEKFVKGMELTAQRYIKELSGALWTPTPEMLAKAAFIGATKIARGTLEIAKWTDEMVADLGEKFRPYAAQVYDMANKTLEAQLKKVPKPVQEAVKSKPSIGTKEAIAKKIGDKIEKGKADQIWFLVNKLARELYKEGITEREAMVDALHQFLPELSREEVRDAFSGYGNYRPLTKDAISIGLRGMKGELLEIAKLEAMAKGEPPLKSGAERGEITEARRQLIKKVNDAKYKFQVPVEDPETQLKSALDTLKTTLKNRITDYEDRLARGDFAPRPRREIVLDRTAMELKAQAEKVKRRWRAALLADQLKNRTRYERAMDTLVKWRRGFVLSGFTTLGKLTSAAVQRMTFTPAEEAVGAAWQKLPGIRKISERAPREGGFSPKAEAQAITQAWTQGRKDAWQVLKTGRGTLDYLFGTKDTYIGELDAEQRSIVDFFGQMHGFLKAPVKRAEFARSMEKRLEWNIRQGVDVSDPLIQTRIAIEAYKDGNRSIFLQDNMVSDKVRRFINSFEQKSKATGQVPIMGKLAATTGRVLLPITKVPTNIVAETIQYAIGAERGLFKAMRAIRAGTENLKPEEADLIMRDLKKGALGSAFLLIGFFSPEVIGGYYQPGEKRRKSDVKPGMIRMYGQEVPSFLLHNPLLETLQLGATIRRVSDSKLRKRDTENQGIGAGIQAGALGLTEQVPFVREMMEVTKAWNPRERGAFFGELGKSIIIPQGVQQAARYFDQNAAGETIVRKPRNMVEHIETGIPGLRENVPRAPRQPSR